MLTLFELKNLFMPQAALFASGLDYKFKDDVQAQTEGSEFMLNISPSCAMAWQTMPASSSEFPCFSPFRWYLRPSGLWFCPSSNEAFASAVFLSLSCLSASSLWREPPCLLILCAYDQQISTVSPWWFPVKFSLILFAPKLFMLNHCYEYEIVS